MPRYRVGRRLEIEQYTDVDAESPEEAIAEARGIEDSEYWNTDGYGDCPYDTYNIRAFTDKVCCQCGVVATWQIVHYEELMFMCGQHRFKVSVNARSLDAPYKETHLLGANF